MKTKFIITLDEDTVAILLALHNEFEQKTGQIVTAYSFTDYLLSLGLKYFCDNKDKLFQQIVAHFKNNKN